jgi:hypothetical protein
MPRVKNISYGYDAIEQALVWPATRSLDLALLARKLGGPARAANVDSADQAFPAEHMVATRLL